MTPKWEPVSENSIRKLVISTSISKLPLEIRNQESNYTNLRNQKQDLKLENENEELKLEENYTLYSPLFDTGEFTLGIIFTVIIFSILFLQYFYLLISGSGKIIPGCYRNDELARAGHARENRRRYLNATVLYIATRGNGKG